MSQKRLDCLSDLLEEDSHHEVTIARRRDGRIWISDFDSVCFSGDDLESAIDAAILARNKPLES